MLLYDVFYYDNSCDFDMLLPTARADIKYAVCKNGEHKTLRPVKRQDEAGKDYWDWEREIPMRNTLTVQWATGFDVNTISHFPGTADSHGEFFTRDIQAQDAAGNKVILCLFARTIQALQLPGEREEARLLHVGCPD